MNRLAIAWRQRSAGERRTLAWGAAIVALLLVVTFAWLPLERTRQRLAAELPALRASIASLERDAAEVDRLRKQPAAAPLAGTPLASLATNAGGLPGAQIAVLDARRVRVTGADMSFGALLEWLRNAQATHGMRVESARVDALPATGRVRAELLLTKS
ncbi:MAG TPA: type II secretion system protein M [Usitatibacter sp.]|nr:type II secretion system protein M [Usitatibacter sp.]